MSNRKKVKNSRKPRSPEVRVDFGREQVLTGIKWADDGRLTFFGEHGEVVTPVYVEVGSAYARPSKTAKALTRQSTLTDNVQLDPNKALARFASLAAVDTNTTTIAQRQVSVSASVLILNIQVGDKTWKASVVPQSSFEFHDSTVVPERVGWWNIIQRIAGRPDLPKPVGLIVDSDLGALREINARKAPIMDGCLLPPDIELLYGCGDRGTQEFITSAAVADCDRVSSEILERIRTQGFIGTRDESGGAPYTAHRYWHSP